MGNKHKLARLWWPILALVPLVLAVAVATSPAKSKGNGWLGIYLQNIDEDLMASEGLPSTDGVMVVDVVEDSPAEKAGIKRGDVILAYDGEDTRSANRLTRLVERTEPGQEKQLVVLRDGKKEEIAVTLGDEDDQLESAFFGDGDFHVELPDVPAPPRAYTFSLGNISTSRIGVSLYELSDQLAKHYGAVDGGALINEVVEESPAEKAGLRAGDVIVKMDGEPVGDVDEIREAIQDKEEGETIAVTVLRDGTESSFDVEVEESSTWSGIGDNRFFAPRSPGVRPFRWQSRDNWSDARESMREALRESRGANSEWREELQEAMKELREEMRELKKELQEKGL